MIPTVPIDWLLSFLVGELCALVGHPVATPQAPWGAPFRYALGFGAFVFVPIGLVLMVFFPGWSWMYLLDPQEYSPLLGILAIYGYILALVAGYALCARHCRRPTTRRGALLVPLFLLLALMASTLDRLWVVGSFADYINGRGIDLPHSSLAPLLSLIIAAFIWGLVVTLRAIARLQRDEG